MYAVRHLLVLLHLPYTVRESTHITTVVEVCAVGHLLVLLHLSYKQSWADANVFASSRTRRESILTTRNVKTRHH